MTKWTNEDSEAAQREGWDIFEVYGTPYSEIQRVDYLARFPHDDAAMDHVAACAEQCSELHQRALAYISGTNEVEAEGTWTLSNI